MFNIKKCHFRTRRQIVYVLAVQIMYLYSIFLTFNFLTFLTITIINFHKFITDEK